MKTCEIDGCDKPYRARGLCATHYNQKYQPNRHRKSDAECSWCGKRSIKGVDHRHQRRYCSDLCLGAMRAYEGKGVLTCPLPSRAVVLWVPPEAVEDVANWRRWVSGHCVRCGEWFVAEDYTNTARYCSRQCAKRISRDNYRARRRDAYREDVSPAAIFDRDGWRCQICKRKTKPGVAAPHPLAPVLDHTQPLALGGTHEPKNVQCAHFMCNSTKTHRGSGDQLLLFG